MRISPIPSSSCINASSRRTAFSFPRSSARKEKTSVEESRPEERTFDKAELAGSEAKLEQQLESVVEEIDRSKAEREGSAGRLGLGTQYELDERIEVAVALDGMPQWKIPLDLVSISAAFPAAY